MAKQYRVEIQYDDEFVEEFLIHSDQTLEWITQREKSVTNELAMLGGALRVVNWLVGNSAKRLRVVEEAEV